MNSNDPNKLTWKGTCGPYLVEKQEPSKHGGINIHRTTVCRVSDQAGHYQTLADVYGTSAEQCKANAHLISAAPEAIEFIADLVYALSNGDDHLVAEMIPRAEEILKKAYNH